jgi:hypothetical protein
MHLLREYSPIKNSIPVNFLIQYVEECYPLQFVAVTKAAYSLSCNISKYLGMDKSRGDRNTQTEAAPRTETHFTNNVGTS